MAKCAKCSKLLSKKNPGLQCCKCNKWLHALCASISTEQLNALVATDSIDWKCRACIGSAKPKRLSAILPDLEEEEQTDTESLISPDDFRKNILSDIRREIREIIRDELQRSLKFYSEKIDDFQMKIEEYEIKIKDMSKHYVDVENKYKNVNMKYEAMEQKINNIEQSLLCNNFEVCGINKIDNENNQDTLNKLALKLNQKPGDIVKVYRKESQSNPGKTRSQSTLVVTVMEGRRDMWLEASKRVQVYSKDLGIEGESAVYLREALAPATAFLLWKTKTELRNTNLFKFVWCKRGSVLIRKSDKKEDKVHVIKCTKDIEKWKMEERE